MYTRLVSLGLAVTLLHAVSGQNLSAADISTVTTRLAEGATHSWELGTRSEASLELYAPNFSVFTSTQLPPSTTIPSNTTSAIAPVFSIARNVVSGRGASNGNVTGPQPLLRDGSAGDPASIGVAVLMANWTGQGAADGQDYARAARDQLDYLLNVVPHTSDGAISHRVAQVQLWSDSVYMVPPFLAYYGMITSNTTLITEAYNQIKLYRNYLRDTNAKNLWKHIVLSNDTSDSPTDEGHWSTGNAWAAAGMLRVLATMKNSQFSKSFSSQQKDLASWVKEIHTAMYANIDSTNIFTNYADIPISTSGMFYDTASTTLLASTVYRFSLLWNDHTHLPNAEKCREALYAAGTASTSASSSSSKTTTSSAESEKASATGSASESGSKSASSTSATMTPPSATPSPTTAPLTDLVHFTNDGWLTPVVNPNQYGVEGSNSPEGEAFVLKFQAAYSEWVAGGSVGANAARRTMTSTAGWVGLVGCAVLGGLLAFV
ncbi:Six-hairpin glycosidase-like protein [Mycena sp. CBHHK59/15]|nr:Six-hairpin glycosidase-like protein [Mycena sp. CBHHK59/15]